LAMPHRLLWRGPERLIRKHPKRTLLKSAKRAMRSSWTAAFGGKKRLHLLCIGARIAPTPAISHPRSLLGLAPAGAVHGFVWGKPSFEITGTRSTPLTERRESSYNVASGTTTCEAIRPTQGTALSANIGRSVCSLLPLRFCRMYRGRMGRSASLRRRSSGKSSLAPISLPCSARRTKSKTLSLPMPMKAYLSSVACGFFYAVGHGPLQAYIRVLRALPPVQLVVYLLYRNILGRRR
jgi:hypothetical protein